jgi:hypothetical protein
VQDHGSHLITSGKEVAQHTEVLLNSKTLSDAGANKEGASLCISPAIQTKGFRALDLASALPYDIEMLRREPLVG